MEGSRKRKRSTNVDKLSNRLKRVHIQPRTLNERQKKELAVVMDWLNEKLRYKDVPRFSDIWDAAVRFGFARTLPKRALFQSVRLHPAYAYNSSQQLARKRARKYRPVVANSLGHLHGDLGFFAVRRDYETPKTYRAGYLVAKDVLSRYTYIVLLRGSKDADAMVKAFQELLERHRARTGEPILSISFDKETSVMSNKVQTFLKENHIAFHPFSLTSSKSKFAEGAIRLIRTEMKRLERFDDTGKFRWWQHLQDVADTLNRRPIVVDGKPLPYTPADVTTSNLADFLAALHKAAPSYYWSQYDIAPDLVHFKFAPGQLVRVKLLATSSAVVGNKRSETNLEPHLFRVQEQQAYVTRRHTLGRAYKCVNLTTKEVEIFDEFDLASAE